MSELASQDSRVVIDLSLEDARRLYDHIAAMPLPVGEALSHWSSHVRVALAKGLTK